MTPRYQWCQSDTGVLYTYVYTPLALSQAAVLQAAAATPHFGHFVERSKGVPAWYRRVAYGFHDTEVWGPPH